MDKAEQAKLKDHVTHHVALVGEYNGAIDYSRSLKLNINEAIRSILSYFVRFPLRIIVQTRIKSQHLENLCSNQSVRDLLFHKEKLAQPQPGLIFRILQRVFRPLPEEICYFLLDSENQVNALLPLCTEAYLDTYYLFHADQEQKVKSIIINRRPLREIWKICDAVVPAWGCSNTLEFNIMSNKITYAEFQNIVETVFVNHNVKEIDKTEIQEFWRGFLATEGYYR